MNSVIGSASVLNFALASTVSAGFCGEQAARRAAQAAKVTRRFKLFPKHSGCSNPYFAILTRVRLNTVSGGLQKVTSGLSYRVHEGNGEDIAELAAQLRARQALGRSDGLNRLFDYL